MRETMRETRAVGVLGGMRQPHDVDGAPLLEGDRVIGISSGFPGEAGIILRATGSTLVQIRLDASGVICSSAASLWRKVRSDD